MEIRMDWATFKSIPAEEIILIINTRLCFVDSDKPELGFRTL